VHIINDGSLNHDNFISTLNTRGNSDIQLEADYPVPSLLLALLAIVSTIPQNFLLFVPISGLASIIYFVLARRILCESKYATVYVLLFSTFYYLFMMSSRIHGSYTGRATLGAVLLPFFLFCYANFIYKHLTKGGHKFPWFVLSCIFAITIGYTYYTSTSAIIVITLFVSLVTFVMGLIKKRIPSFVGLSITAISLFLFTLAGYSSTIFGKVRFDVFFNNIVQYVLMKFTGEGELLRRMDYSGLIEVDYLIAGLRSFSSIIIFACLVAIAFALVRYSPKTKKIFSFKLIWIFSIFAFLSGLSEFAYIFETQAFPTRFFVMFGLIVLLYIVLVELTYNVNFLRKILGKVAILSLLVIILLACVGMFSYSWNYGQSAGKPYSYSQVRPMADFICIYSIDDVPVMVSGDAGYVSNLFFISSLRNKTNSVVAIPIGEDAISLHYWLSDGQLNFSRSMDRRQIDYLLMISTERPLWGNDWGYVIPTPKKEVFYPYFSSIYDNGKSQLYGM